MAGFEDGSKVSVTLGGVLAVRGPVVDVTPVADHHPVPDGNAVHRPDFGALSDIGPLPDDDLAAVPVRQEPPLHHTMLADRDASKVAPVVFEGPRRSDDSRWRDYSLVGSSRVARQVAGDPGEETVLGPRLQTTEKRARHGHGVFRSRLSGVKPPDSS